MDSQGKGLIKALENWAKKVTEGYRDVNVRDMSSSFRDGLAFCAIIHHYRPDLIEFDSLSKENILENNQIAFSVAEKQLGVPALLDAEDMVKYSRPDRLSIITYLSQLHNCFENQNKVRSVFKRIQSNAISPPSKVLASQPQLLTARRVEVCQVCKNRVFILERLIVDRKLYHTACFRCCKCNALLNPGAYVESDTPGKYECTVCLPEEKLNSMDTDDTNSHSSLEEKNNSLENTVPQPLHSVQNNFVSPLSESVTRARASFLERSLTPKSNEATKVPSSKLDVSPTTYDKSINPLAKESFPRNGVSVKDKISVFESSRNSSLNSLKFEEPSPSKKHTENFTSKSTSKADNSLNKSPRPSVRLSLLSSAISSKDNFSQKVSNEKSFINSTLNKKDNLPSSNSIETSKNFSSNSVEVSSSSDILNCDNVTVKSVDSKVFSVDNASSVQNSSSNSELSTKEPEKVKKLGDPKTDMKTSSDIFQNKFQPLKLTIPTISSSIKNESVSLPITPVHTSPDSVRATVEIAQIRPTYTRSLARPLSYTSLSSRDKTSITVENSSPSILNNNILRRNSFDSDRQNTDDSFSSSVKGKVSYNNNSSPSLETKTYQNSSNSLDDVNKLKISKVSDVSKSTVNNSSTFDIRKITPTPSIRKSREIKDTGLQKDLSKSKLKSEVPAVKKVSTSTLNLKPVQPKSRDVSPNHLLPNKDTADSSPVKLPTTPVPSEEKAENSYPDDLNPFGDDEIEEEYPDDLNPFGDDDDNEEVQETPKVFEGVSADNYDESKNPFASDEEEVETSSYTPSPKPPNSQTNSPFGTLSSLSSPTGSLRGTTKKRKAPKPPKVTDIFPNAATDSEGDVSFNSVRSSPAVSRKALQTPSPKLRKNKPAPPPPPVASPRQNSQNDVTASVKQAKDSENMKLKSSATKEPTKKKKRPAPPVPIPMRKDRKKIPLKEIMREMKEIELKQREFETQGREIELLIRDRDKDEEPSVEEEEYIMQLFELVNQKNALFRRQAELMYIKRSQRLEEQQEELEKQIRLLMAKPENEKTDEDKTKEEELIYELTDIVDQRNSIIDSIEMDRRRELEEDVSVQEQIEMKNGDLPIAAEIKEKSKEKKKKDKKKKDKKKDKHHENGDSGKSTLKRKLFK